MSISLLTYCLDNLSVRSDSLLERGVERLSEGGLKAGRWQRQHNVDWTQQTAFSRLEALTAMMNVPPL